MRQHVLAALGILAAATMFGSLSAVGVARQAPKAAPTTWKAPMTPWGEPDLQGIWNEKTLTPLERPQEFAGKEFLTDAEVAALEAQASDHPSQFKVATRDVRAAKGTVADVDGAYNDIFNSSASGFPKGKKFIRTNRTSLIVDPPDGKLPPLTPEAKKKAEAAQGARRGGSLDDPDDPRTRADGPEDRSKGDRCLGVSLPCIQATCAFSRMTQSPGYLTVYYEAGHMGGSYRIIPLDGSPHLPPDTREWLGDSRGRWEGATLVVDTTNFTDRRNFNFQGTTKNLHVIERFTRVADDMILYRATIDDPTLYTKPWTLEMALTEADNKQNQIYESACYEGNYALTSILAGARAVEKKAVTTNNGSR